jgi:hypothetical protein
MAPVAHPPGTISPTRVLGTDAAPSPEPAGGSPGGDDGIAVLARGVVNLEATAAEGAAAHGTTLTLFAAPACRPVEADAAPSSGSGAAQAHAFYDHWGVPEEEERRLEALPPARTDAWQCDGGTNAEVSGTLSVRCKASL